MKVKSIGAAWRAAVEIFPTDYERSSERSAAAGYDIYTSTVEGVAAWISDLGDRLEVNLSDGETVNIWIVADELPQVSECQIGDALRVIDACLYRIEDNITLELQAALGLDEARKTIYAGFGRAAELLQRYYPTSALFDMYNLRDF